MQLEDLALSRRVRRAGLREEVYDALLELLIENRIDEGSPLRVESVSRLLDVSPTPVREALVQLESTGLVSYVANKGYSVAPRLTPEDIVELMDARTVLETAAAARAATAADDDAIATLRRLIEEQTAAARAVESADEAEHTAAVRAYLRLDHAFHDTIFAASGNMHLHALAQRLDAQSQRARQSFRYGVSDAQEALAEHAAIAVAIGAHDPVASETAMREHLRGVLARSLADAA
ncbi:GntR family transcriptional regulator [Leifsonia shinshuensis]|uniref:GntR family transcriptional regulator n=1 Tax=Leifsonia shinshuensis TaxID=150026 RepID=A0A7G6YE38_9MICO|nr:GntR family transcriptional regulator [Leifsonia shinshuensis]QNE36753.1 GntR family transcriptional regulator [Leifsonia shinshuensis]